MEDLIVLSIRAQDYDEPTSWRLANWCRTHGADEWTVSLIEVDKANTGLHEQFEEISQPFRLPSANRDRLTTLSGDESVRTTQLWQLNAAAFALLQRFMPEGLFAYPSYTDEWLEDVILYRRGELMLGMVSHEGEGVLRVMERERSMLEDEGFVFTPRGNYVG